MIGPGPDPRALAWSRFLELRHKMYAQPYDPTTFEAMVAESARLAREHRLEVGDADEIQALQRRLAELMARVAA